MLCELCGKKESSLQVRVEGSCLNLCRDCKGFGEVVGAVKSQNLPALREKIVSAELPSESIVSSYAILIKNARERLGKTQEEFAKLVREKISVVHKLETGQFEPPVALARKLEKILRINLVETGDKSVVELPKSNKTESFTIGDFIKLQSKKLIKKG